jgi:WD40 repeat protein
MLLTGGDDSVVRLYKMAEDFKSTSKKVEFKTCGEMPITAVDISRDNSMIVAASKDANAYIISLKTQKVIQKLSFRCQP